MAEIKVGGYYRHFKGGVYKVVGMATLAHHYTPEGEEGAVLYKEADGRVGPDGRVYCRPTSDWAQWVTREDGRSVRRFTLMEWG